MRQISILLGAGFSVPDNYPTRWEINKRLNKIDESEIMIHTNGDAIFLKGLKDPNSKLTGLVERNFLQQFLEFYNREIIKPSEFDYEVFFDFYHGILNGNVVSEKFNDFADSFRESYGISANNRYSNNINLIGRFHTSYNQLLGGLLTKWPERVHLARPYSKYKEFLTMIELLKEEYDIIHIHTLNHDLLLEELSHSDAMVDGFCDGYELNGTPFFGMYKEIYPVRLRYFTNKFDKKIRLYKLHGSIDSYIFDRKSSGLASIKILPGVNTSTLSREYVNKNGELEVDNFAWNYYPDFLSGTTEKIKRYNSSNYYTAVFKHFEDNLKSSDRLITIGYGLADSKINEFIEDNFLSVDNRKVLVIDPKKSHSSIYNYDEVLHYGDKLGVSDIDLDKVREFIN